MFVKAAGEFAWLGLSIIAPPILKTFKVFHKILLVRDVYPSYVQNISYWCNGNKERDVSLELLPWDDLLLHLPNLLHFACVAGYKQYLTFVCGI